MVGRFARGAPPAERRESRRSEGRSPWRRQIEAWRRQLTASRLGSTLRAMEGVAKTALWVAAWRARESERETPLFVDPFARDLAGEEGFATLRAADEARSGSAPTIEIRTYFLDERIRERMSDRGLDQVAILAAGMDSRAWRLAWPEGVRLFEIDQPHVLAYKADKLAERGAAARCARHEVLVDLRDDWPRALLAAGFDAARPTLWLVEGLLLYLDEAAVETLFARLAALSAPHSVALYDLIGRGLLESHWMTQARAFAASLGAPWIYGTDEPESLLGRHGWDATWRDFSEIGVELGRWPFPHVPRDWKGVPRSYLVEAVKP
jgi:methyltransferase (TIGR00027 family)